MIDKKKILIVVGTRPNFIKVTRFKKVVEAHYGQAMEIKLVHTGQHYDFKMTDVFFQQLNLNPDFFLGISPGNANVQMGEIMIKFDALLDQYKPNWVVVVGDVNSTFAAAFTAHRAGIKVAHVESGLRSNDKTMPEEINRILTDEISDLFFVTEQSGLNNLIAEGKNPTNIHFVGNTMIDTMVAFETEIQASEIMSKMALTKDNYVLMTMHRPATVDNIDGISKLYNIVNYITQNQRLKLVFPIHPRTHNKLKEFGYLQKLENNTNLIFAEPLDYFSFQNLVSNCKFILTDSGGIQEESTFRLKPCITLRPNTERPSTVEIGSNVLMPFDIAKIEQEIANIVSKNYKMAVIPPLWDGFSTERIVDVLAKS